MAAAIVYLQERLKIHTIHAVINLLAHDRWHYSPALNLLHLGPDLMCLKLLLIPALSQASQYLAASPSLVSIVYLLRLICRGWPLLDSSFIWLPQHLSSPAVMLTYLAPPGSTTLWLNVPLKLSWIQSYIEQILGSMNGLYRLSILGINWFFGHLDCEQTSRPYILDALLQFDFHIQ